MWSKWKSLSEVQRSQLVLCALVVLIAVGIVVNSGRENTSPSPIEMPRKASVAAPDVPYEPKPIDQSSQPPSSNPYAQGVPPTAVVDGVTYTGEQQIEALTQAARDAGLSEPDARRTGREAAILCNGNPDCLR